MRIPCLVVCSSFLMSCAPGNAIVNQKSNNRGGKQSAGSDTVPVVEIIRLPTDPEEDDKAMEPAIIGGAYLFCDATADMVGCRIANVPENDWFAASKKPDAINLADGSGNACPVVLPEPGAPYHVILEAPRAQQNLLELQLDITLPQGQLKMTTTVNPSSPKALEQRTGQGLALYAAKGPLSDWPGLDRKTWNLWMPLKLPRVIANFEESAGAGSVDLIFDETICTYRQQEAVYAFDSCTKNAWQPDQIIRTRSLTLRVPQGSAGVVLETAP